VATTKTARLNLAKQDAGDTDWNTDLDQGFDDADDRLLKVSSDNGDASDPNVGPIVGDYVGQKYIDETSNPPRVWYCTTDSDPGPSVWRLANATGIASTAPGYGGNVNLEAILADYQSRLAALEADQHVVRGHIDGLTLTRENGGLEYGVAAGKTADSTETVWLSRGSAWTKTLASWVADDGNGGISPTVWTADGDAVVNLKWYHVFLTWDAVNGHDICCDDDIDGTNLATDGFIYYGYIGSIQIESADAEVRRFSQIGDWFFDHDPDETGVFYEDTSVAKNQDDSYTANVPTDVPVVAIISLSVRDGSGNVQAYMTGEQESLPGACSIWEEHGKVYAYDGNYAASGQAFIPLNTYRDVVFRVDGDGATIDHVALCTIGYYNPRGKNF